MLSSLDSKLCVTNSLYLGHITYSVHYTYKMHCVFPFSPCSTLWFCRFANIIEREILFSYLLFSVLWVPDFDQGFGIWHPGSIATWVPCWMERSQTFWMISFSWGYMVPGILQVHFAFNKDDIMWSVVIGTSKWPTKYFPVMSPSLNLFNWFLFLEKSPN